MIDLKSLMAFVQAQASGVPATSLSSLELTALTNLHDEDLREVLLRMAEGISLKQALLDTLLISQEDVMENFGPVGLDVLPVEVGKRIRHLSLLPPSAVER